MRITTYEHWQETECLQPHWNALLEGSASDTFFLSRPWMAAWWKAYGSGRKLLVIAGWEGERLVGVAPLYVERVRRMGAWWNVARLLGDGSNDSDYLDFFCHPEQEQEFTREVVLYLDSRRDLWDVLELHGPRESSPFALAVQQQFQRLRWKFRSDEVPCLTLDLPGTWDEYLRSLKPRFRTKLRSALSFAEQELKLSPVACTSLEQLHDWLPQFFSLHSRRWKTRGQAGVFATEGKRNFYLEISTAALDLGTLSFHRLDWGERPLAFQYGFLYGKSFLLLQEAYDPAFESLRPGLVLRGFRLREMIASGLKNYDFLAGVAPHKLEWGAAMKRSVKLVAAASPAAAAVFLEVPFAQRHIKDVVSSFVPRPLLTLRRSMLQANRADESAGLQRNSESLLGRIYCTAPVRKLSRWTADQFQFAPGNRSLFHIQRRNHPVCQILLYHKVNDDRDPYFHSLPVSEFRAQMEYVAKNFSLVTLDDIAAGKTSRNGGKFSVAVTFDDGYRDNFTHAFPVLKELGIPATIYLATGYIGTGKVPWYDQVCLAFKLTGRSELRLEGGAPCGSLATDAGRLALLDRVLEWLRDMDDDLRPARMKTLFHSLGVPEFLTLPNYMLNWDEVRQMKAHNISFGAHTVNHPVLSQLSLSRLRQEIAESKKTIEQNLKAEVRHFAYPFGRPQHFNQDVKQVVEQCGMATAVTTVYGYNSPGDDLFTLKRFTPWAHDRAKFMMQMDWFRFAGIDSPETTGKMAGQHVAAAPAG